MRKVIVILFFMFMIVNVKSYDTTDCQYFVLPKLGINHYQTCLQNPDAYSEHYVYHTVRFYVDGSIYDTQSVRDGDSADNPGTPSKVGYDFDGWEVDFSSVESNLYINATFSVSTSRVTFLDYDGTVIKTESVEYGMDATPPSVSRTGYEHIGWSDSYKNVTSDITVVAEYDRLSYVVKFYSGNTLLKSTLVDYMKDALPPASPTKSGYTFTGWDKSYENITGNTNIYAEFEKNSYIITFKDYDGTTIRSESVLYGEDATPPIVSREGYVHTGWSDSYLNVKRSLTLIATYDKLNYIVNFYEGSNLLSSQTVNYMESATAPTPPLKIGYSFTSWSDSFNGISGNKDIYAEYDRLSYTVTFKDYDLSTLKSEIVYYGEDALPPNPTRLGYNFIGWSGEYNNITQDKTLIAEYEVIEHTVTFFDFYGGLITRTNVRDGYSVTPPNPPNVDGHTFDSWSENLTNIESDLDIYAEYTVNTYNVTYVDYNGMVLKTDTVVYQDDSSPPVVDREGYTFTGWSDSYLSIESDITLIAQYQSNEHIVTFYDYLGNVIKSETIVSGYSAVPPTLPVREGYTFVGWDKSYTNVREDLSIYPIYQINEYKVTFLDYDGRIVDEQMVEYMKDAVIESPEREGYDFTSWSDSLESITSSKTLVAEYEIKTFIVRFLIDDNIIKEETVNYNSSATPPTPLDKEGHSFTHWDDYDHITSDRDIYGHYEIDEYKVTFLNYDGSVLKEEYICYGMSANPPKATKEGAIFLSWSDDYTYITSDITLIAEFAYDVYTVHFYGVDGVLISSETVAKNESANPPDPTTDGYIFVYWNGNFSNVTKDEHVYGVYDQIIMSSDKYTVSFYGYDNELLDTFIVDAYSAISYEINEHPAYEFLSWDKDLSSIKANLEVRPIYSRKMLEVVVYLEEEIRYLVSYGDSLELDEPKADGYEFLGWSEDINNIKSNLEVYPLFEEIIEPNDIIEPIIDLPSSSDTIPEEYEIDYRIKKTSPFVVRLMVDDVEDILINYLIVGGEEYYDYSVKYDSKGLFDRNADWIEIKSDASFEEVHITEAGVSKIIFIETVNDFRLASSVTFLDKILMWFAKIVNIFS